MRLIDTKSRLLVEYLGDNTPPYAILSHTWEDGEEVTYQDYVGQENLHKKGWEKIRKACGLAEERLLSFVWVDTACIDKRSSSELSEAINSMYQWYENSKICFAFLSDWEEASDSIDSLRRCRWFTRGWTLQELIAPKELDFFDAKGNLRGTKQSLVQQLSAITRIDQSLLEGGKTLVGFSVAQKMSWAASRRTTRKEDEAYCLLGLFDLNMPLLYGEGNKAFRRLQEEIIRTTVDLSIFAWNIPRLPSQAIDLEPSLCGVLAHTPAYFADCGAFQSGQGGVDGLRAISTSNFGIDIRTRMHLRPCGNGGQGYVLPVVFQSSGYIGIKLRQVGHDQYLRGDPYALEESYQGFFRGTVPPVERFLLTSIPTMPQTRVALERQLLLKLRYYLLQFERPPTMFFSDPWPLHRYDHEDRAFFGPFNSRRDFGCINVVAHVEVPGLGRVVVDCRFSAFCWYKDPPENAQFGLTESRLYDAQFASAQTWVADWDRDSLQFMSKLNELRVPKQSGVLIETENPNFAIVMTFKAERVKDINLAAVHWRVSFDCVVLHVGDHPGFDKEWWNLDSLSQQSSVAPTAPYIDDSRVPDAVPGVE